MQLNETALPFIFVAAREKDELKEEELKLLVETNNPKEWMYNVTFVVIPVFSKEPITSFIKLPMCVHPHEHTKACYCKRPTEMVKEDRKSEWVANWVSMILETAPEDK